MDEIGNKEENRNLVPQFIIEDRNASPETIWYKKKRYLFVGVGIIIIILGAAIFTSLYFTGMIFKRSRNTTSITLLSTNLPKTTEDYWDYSDEEIKGIVKILDEAIYDDYNAGGSITNTIKDDKKCKAGCTHVSSFCVKTVYARHRRLAEACADNINRHKSCSKLFC